MHIYYFYAVIYIMKSMKNLHLFWRIAKGLSVEQIEDLEYPFKTQCELFVVCVSRMN